MEFSLKKKLSAAGFSCEVAHRIKKEGAVVEVYLQRIRLLEKKPYCGQHPGSCPVGARKPLSRYLEWDDWIRFNKVVNDVLDVRRSQHFEVFSMPQDVRGRFWIRKNNKPRRHYDWEETEGRFGHPIRIWDKGTESQFED